MKCLTTRTIDTSKETLIEKLGQTDVSSKNKNSDYEILTYLSYNTIGLRGGKIEWISKIPISYPIY